MFCINQSHILLKPVDNCVNPVNPSHPNPRQREKIKLNFYFRTSLWQHKKWGNKKLT